MSIIEEAIVSSVNKAIKKYKVNEVSGYDYFEKHNLSKYGNDATIINTTFSDLTRKLVSETFNSTFYSHNKVYTSLFNSPYMIESIKFKDAISLYDSIKDESMGMLLAKEKAIINPFNAFIAPAYKNCYLKEYECNFRAYIYPKCSNMNKLEIANLSKLDTHNYYEDLKTTINTIEELKKDFLLFNTKNEMSSIRYDTTDIFISKRIKTNSSRFRLMLNSPNFNLLVPVGILNINIIYPYYGAIFITKASNLKNYKGVNFTPFISGNVSNTQKVYTDVDTDKINSLEKFLKTTDLYKGDIYSSMNSMSIKVPELDRISRVCTGNQHDGFINNLYKLYHSNQNSSYTHNTIGDGAIDFMNASIKLSLEIYKGGINEQTDDIKQ